MLAGIVLMRCMRRPSNREEGRRQAWRVAAGLVSALARIAPEAALGTQRQAARLAVARVSAVPLALGSVAAEHLGSAWSATAAARRHVHEITALCSWCCRHGG